MCADLPVDDIAQLCEPIVLMLVIYGNMFVRNPIDQASLKTVL